MPGVIAPVLPTVINIVAAMERLFALNKIRIEKDGPPSRIRSWIAENKPDLADVLRQSTRREDRA